MSDGLYEVFAKRNRKKKLKEYRINKHVRIMPYANGKKAIVHNDLEGTQIKLKKLTIARILKVLDECSTK